MLCRWGLPRMSRVLPQIVEMSKNTRTPFAFSAIYWYSSQKKLNKGFGLGCVCPFVKGSQAFSKKKNSLRQPRIYRIGQICFCYSVNISNKLFMAKDTSIPLKCCYAPTQSRKKVATMKKTQPTKAGRCILKSKKDTDLKQMFQEFETFADLTLLTCLSSNFPGFPVFQCYS